MVRVAGLRILVLLIVSSLMVGCTFWNNSTTEIENQSASVPAEIRNAERYVNSELGFSIALPETLTVEQNGDHSVLLVPKTQEPGQGATNFVYLSVVPAEEFAEIGTVYNYTPGLFAKTRDLKIGESVSLVDAGESELDQWYTYAYVDEVVIAGHQASVLENYKPWEFPIGTTETRYIFEANGNRYVLGYYTGGDGVSNGLDPRLAYPLIMSFALEEAVTEDTQAAIEALLAEKYPELDMSTQQVVVEKDTGRFASGRFDPISGPVGGGYFYAAKNSNGMWGLVADGNGAIMCEAVELANFPIDMIPECFDEGSVETVVR